MKQTLNRTLKLSFMAISLAAIAACASTTPYQQANGRGDGYSEQKIERDKYRISFSGNSLTDRATVENYVLYRAAEVTIQTGNDYFIMLEDSEDIRRSFRTSGTSFGGGGFGSTHSTTRERTEYTIGAIIQVYKGEKPASNPTAYDARSVIDSLGGSIQRPVS